MKKWKDILRGTTILCITVIEWKVATLEKWCKFVMAKTKAENQIANLTFNH